MRSLLLIQGVALGLAVGWGLSRDLPWWRDLHPGGQLLPAVLAGAGLALASRELFRWLAARGLFDEQWFTQTLLRPLLRDLRLPHFALLAAVSGFAEEALFRGAAAQELGVVASSLLFGVLHTGDRRLILMGVWATLVGFGLGSYYLATHDLLGCMIVHATSNFVSLVTLDASAGASTQTEKARRWYEQQQEL